MVFRCWPSSKEKVETTVIETQTLDSEFVTPSSDTLVIDCGSSTCKCGFAGENNPRVSIPTLVGGPRYRAAIGFRSEEDTYVGFEAQQKRVVLNLTTPIERGIIINWDDMEVYFDYIFSEGLQIDPSLYNILLTKTLNNSQKNDEKLLELMLETFNFKSFYLASAPVLALYAYGFYTGVVLDSGEGQTHIVPVYQGFSMPYGTRYIPLGGKDINNMLASILSQKGKATQFFQTTIKEFLNDIKEQHCYVAFDYQQEFDNPSQKSVSYRLPDGSYINFKKELFRCTEALFEPTMLEVKTGGIHENIYRAIQLSDVSIRDSLYDHIVLSGGNTLFSGLQRRLAKELQTMSEPVTNIRIHAKSDRKNAVFQGASLVGSLAKFKNMMITYNDYFENGPSIVHERCI